MCNSRVSLTLLLVSFLLLFLFQYPKISSHKNLPPESPVERISVSAEIELKARVDKSFGKIPIRFETNVGQTDERVKFLAREKGYSLFLTPEEAVMVLPVGPAKSATDLSGSVKKVSLENSETRHAAIRMSLLDANPAPKMFGEDELITKSAYFIGSDPAQWQTGVANYGKVRYEEAYPGIDLIYYGNPQQLEYDFVVSPGAAPDVIKIKFEGQDAIAIDEAGNLVLQVGSGRIVQNAPVVYQSVVGQRIPVPGRYVLLGADSVGFKIGGYDSKKDLIIDPNVSFSTYLGGAGIDEGQSIAADSSGNVYVFGETASADFPTASAFDATLGGSRDLFVSKLNAGGTALIYSTYLGGAGSELADAIAVDSSGNAYVIGDTQSSDFPTVGAIDSTLGGTQDAFVTKLNASGSALTYSTYLGGSSNDEGDSIAVDSSGNAYVTGLTESSDFPTTVGAFDTILGGTDDAFVSKLNAAGSALTYSTYLGGSSTDSGHAIAVDSSGNAYITGDTESSDFPVVDPIDSTLGGTTDAFVSRLNAAGSLLPFSTYLGGAGIDGGDSIAVDSSGNAYVTGLTQSADFPTTAGAVDAALGGVEDAFVSKLKTAGSVLTFSTYLGGAGIDGADDIAVDASGNVYVAGVTASTDFPTVDPIDSTFGGIEEAFISKLNAAGSALDFSTYLGGSGIDGGHGIAVDAFGNIYVTGDTASSDFPFAGSTLDNTLGGTDAYIVKIIDVVAGGAVPPLESRFGIISPYWQAEAGIYTFVSVNHPSLSGMNSQIGVAMSAVNQDGSLKGTLEFTLSSNNSQRLFITTTNFFFGPDSNPDDRFLITGNSPRQGRLQFTPVASNPEVKLGIANSLGRGFADITALSYWGAIVIVNSSTGFAMEFVGDMQDSRAFSSTNFSGVN